MKHLIVWKESSCWVPNMKEALGWLAMGNRWLVSVQGWPLTDEDKARLRAWHGGRE